MLRTLNTVLGVATLTTTLSILRLQWPRARGRDTAAMVRPPNHMHSAVHGPHGSVGIGGGCRWWPAGAGGGRTAWVV